MHWTKLLHICRLDAPIRIITLIPPVEPITITVNSNLHPCTPMDVKLCSKTTTTCYQTEVIQAPSCTCKSRFHFVLGIHTEISPRNTHRILTAFLPKKDFNWLISQPWPQSCYFCSALVMGQWALWAALSSRFGQNISITGSSNCPKKTAWVCAAQLTPNPLRRTEFWFGILCLTKIAVLCNLSWGYCLLNNLFKEMRHDLPLCLKGSNAL